MFSLEKINDIAFITVSNNHHLKLILSSLGAGIFSIAFYNKLMTLSLKEKEDYLKEELYHGKTIGPVCGRIANGRIDDYHYDMNENNVTRHGGKNGLSTLNFDYCCKEKDNTISIIFTKNGFSIEYIININDDSFIVNYEYNGEPQPVALTNHTFFHLGDEFDALRFDVDADYFVECDPNTLVPREKKTIIPCLDFKDKKKVCKDIDDKYLLESRTKGYDHYLHFRKNKELRLLNAKYELYVSTDFDGVLIYSDNYDFKEKTIDNRVGIRKALAVEPQDSPLERKKYGDNNIYHRFIKYIFRKI